MTLSFPSSAPLRLCGLLLLLLSSSANAELTAGASKVSITPDQKEFGYQLGGYVAKERTGHNAVGVHDQCYSRALVISDGTHKAAIVSLDLCFLPSSLKTAVLSRIGTSGIASDGLFLSATHTHSGPDPLALHAANTGPSGSLPTYDAKLADWIADRIAQSISEASARMKPARIGSGQLQGLG